MTSSGYAGAPVIADTPALDLVNTRYTVRTRALDGISSPGDLARWIAEVAPRATGTPADDGPVEVTDADIADFAALRSAVHAVAGALVEGRSPAGSDVGTINRAAKEAGGWRELTLDPRPESVRRSRSTGARRVLGALAEDAVDLFSGERLPQLRACHGPNCPLFFLKNHSRREWCSAACGTRARAARAYLRRTSEN